MEISLDTSGFLNDPSYRESINRLMSIVDTNHESIQTLKVNLQEVVPYPGIQSPEALSLSEDGSVLTIELTFHEYKDGASKSQGLPTVNSVRDSVRFQLEKAAENYGLKLIEDEIS